mmetsp:Transcript_33961/g.71435  ORF Transcript_33961/g.71435 Transcript_33961/m.71435 type:complete len:208 (+) Transcript_33961:82-705(+)
MRVICARFGMLAPVSVLSFHAELLLKLPIADRVKYRYSSADICKGRMDGGSTTASPSTSLPLEPPPEESNALREGNDIAIKMVVNPLHSFVVRFAAGAEESNVLARSARRCSAFRWSIVSPPVAPSSCPGLGSVALLCRCWLCIFFNSERERGRFIFSMLMMDARRDAPISTVFLVEKSSFVFSSSVELSKGSLIVVVSSILTAGCS